MKQSKISLFQCALMLCLLYSLTAGIFYLANQTQTQIDHRFAHLRLAIFILMLPIIIKYLVQLVALPFYSLIERKRLKLQQKLAKNQTAKKVSVLIPAWNEEVGIIKTIQSVLNSNYAAFEVIVINDGSSDKTHQLVTEFVLQHNKNNTLSDSKNNFIPLKYLACDNAGKARALNQALKLATGEIVFTIDADCVMDKNAITKMVQRFNDDKVAAVAGNVVVGNRKKPIELIQQLEYLYGFFFKRADSVFNSVYIIGGAAAAYRKDVLVELGGFDNDIITEDIEMSMRILANGYKTRYAADAVVFTEGPSDFKSLCNQRLRWKFGRILTFIKHKKLFFNLTRKYNPYLTCLALPLAIYVEFALMIEVFSLAIFYTYTIYTSDYIPLAFVILFMTSIICLQIMLDSKAKFHRNLLMLAPVAWLLFYFIDLVELQALYRSIKRFIKREELQWQKWVRTGLLSRSISPAEVAAENESR